MIYLAIPFFFLGLALYAHWVLRGREGVVRWVLFGVAVVGVCGMPWLMPGEWMVGRLAVSMGAALASMRVAEVGWGRFPDPKMQGNVWLFLLAFFTPPDVHEYLVIASLGHTEGHMSAFFALHCLATLGYGVIKKRHPQPLIASKPLAISCHLVWFTATAPLFFAPMIEVLDIHGWRFDI